MNVEMNGRQNGKTIELAMRLREELLQLPQCKLYGIMNCKNKAILLTKEEVIRRDVIKEKNEELEQQITEFKEYVKDSKGQEKIYWRRELAELVGARNVLKGLLEGK